MKASIRELRPITDAQAAELVNPQTKRDLAEHIMMTEPTVAAGRVEAGGRTVAAGRVGDGGRRRWRRRLLVSLPVAASVVAAAIVAMPSGDSGQKVDPVRVGPPNAQAAALSFAEKGDYIVVKIKDPVADPARYKKEFAAHGLDIELIMTPSSPTLVGTFQVIEGSRKIKEITSKGGCELPGGGACTVGLKVPVNYRGHAQISIGRAARPGEQYNSTPQADAPGEALHGMKYRNRTVRTVLAMLRKRNITVPEYRYEGPGGSDKPYENGVPPEKVKQDWYVHDAALWAKSQVLLFVGPKPAR